jgi:hypothetical protein
VVFVADEMFDSQLFVSFIGKGLFLGSGGFSSCIAAIDAAASNIDEAASILALRNF